MPGAGSPTMEYTLSALIIICLGLRSNGQTSEVVTLSMQTQEIDDTFATTLHRHNDYMSSLDKDYVTKGRQEYFLKTTGSDDSTTSTLNDDILRTDNAPEDVQINKNDDNETTTAEMIVTSLNFTTSSVLQTDKVDKGVHVTEYRSTSDNKVAEDATTMTHALTNPVKGHDTTSPFIPRLTTTDVLHVETTAAATTPTMTATTVDDKPLTKSVMTTPKMSTVVKTTTLQQQNVEPISAVVNEEPVNFEDQNSNKVSYNEIFHTAKAIEYNNLYENSPEYIQRRTINHAAVWITVGFVAILLTYILALFIHEKGRSEWRMATQNYAQFENEDDQSRDDTSITIDLDEPSSSFRETSPQIISTDNTHNMMLQQQVIDTTKSH